MYKKKLGGFDLKKKDYLSKSAEFIKNKRRSGSTTTSLSTVLTLVDDL